MDTNILVLTHKTSYLSQIMYELRDREIQQDRMRFRRNLEKVGQLLAYEVSKFLPFQKKEVTTPLGTMEVDVLEEQPIIISILRAGLPLHNGFLDMFDHADNGFISAYRLHTEENKFTIKLEYMATPNLAGRDIILIDPMIATGSSIILCYRSLLERGEPRSIHIAGVIASEEGLTNVRRNIPNARVYVGDLDTELTAKSYIVPGLGDAGDLAFGPKE